MGNAEFAFMSNKSIEQKGIEGNYILQFQFGFICKHRKTNMKIMF